MSREQLAAAVLALPLEDQVELAQALWQNIHEREAVIPQEGPEILEELRRRKNELASGAVATRNHDEVMAAARRAIGCE